MAFTKPTEYLDWVPDGDPTKVVDPPGAQKASGWTEGEPPPFEYMNWLFYQTDQWIKYLSEAIGSEVSVFETITQSRLINGGNWSWDVTSGTLQWSQHFNLSVPSVPDADNQAAASNVVLTDGQVAYLLANIPFTTTGDTNSVTNPNIILNVSNPQNLIVGMNVTGSGIPSSTTILGIVDNGDGTADITISNNATITASGVALTFSSSGALSVIASDNSALVPGPTTIVIARRVGNLVFVGMNSSQMVLQNQESKALNQDGYINVVSIVAGETLAFGDIVYVSQGNPTDPARISGRAYKADTGVTNGAYRFAVAGMVIIGASAAGNALIVESGNFVTSGLTPGLVYYVNPLTPGLLSSSKPTTPNQWVVAVGYAINTSFLALNPGAAANAYQLATAVGVGMGSGGTLAVNPGTDSPYSITSSNNGQVFLVNSANGAMQFNLPVPSASLIFTIKDVGGVFNSTGPCTLHRNGSESIEGLAADYVMQANYGEWTVSCDGTNWFISAR